MVDLSSLKVVRTVDVPAGPVKVLARPDGKVAYVSCSKAQQVAVVDLSQWKVDSLIDAGKGVDGLAGRRRSIAGLHFNHQGSWTHVWEGTRSMLCIRARP